MRVPLECVPANGTPSIIGSPECVISGADVIAFCDNLEKRIRMKSSGSRIETICKAIISVEIDIAVGDGNRPLLDAALVLLRQRLIDESNSKVYGLALFELVTGHA